MAIDNPRWRINSSIYWHQRQVKDVKDRQNSRSLFFRLGCHFPCSALGHSYIERVYCYYLWLSDCVPSPRHNSLGPLGILSNERIPSNYKGMLRIKRIYWTHLAFHWLIKSCSSASKLNRLNRNFSSLRSQYLDSWFHFAEWPLPLRFVGWFIIKWIFEYLGENGTEAH